MPSTSDGEKNSDSSRIEAAAEPPTRPGHHDAGTSVPMDALAGPDGPPRA
jgi:hypothetical protein